MFCPRLKRALATLVVGALVFAAPVGAVPAPTAAGDIPLAEEFWGGPPPRCSSVAVTVLTGPSVEGIGGEATIPGAEPIPCELMLHEVEPAVGMTAELACLIAVHEEGHLHGESHSLDPASIMFWHAEAGEAAAKAPVCVEPPPTRMPHAHPWRHPRRHPRFARRDSL